MCKLYILEKLKLSPYDAYFTAKIKLKMITYQRKWIKDYLHQRFFSKWWHYFVQNFQMKPFQKCPPPSNHTQIWQMLNLAESKSILTRLPNQVLFNAKHHFRFVVLGVIKNFLIRTYCFWLLLYNWKWYYWLYKSKKLFHRSKNLIWKFHSRLPITTCSLR